MVFVTGEAGIGKTTLVEAFLQEAVRDPKVWIGQGQCLEQYGAGEAYLPVLDALSRLCRESERERLVELLRRQAPTWLAQMPSLASDSDREALRREMLGATSERMLREMAEALESLTAETPLVLVLEDLHWSDYSTLDLISYLARRREPAQLMLVGVYRPVDVILSEHPLKAVKQELQWHRRCAELPLADLNETAVGEYLTGRFPQCEFPAELAQSLHGRTEGNPLFLINVVDYLQAEGLIAQRDGRWRLQVEIEELEVGVPENIRQMIAKQIERLSRRQQQLLEASSVAGAEFPAAAVAGGLETDLIKVEEEFEELERQRQFLRSTGVSELPDGTVTARYGFIHALYQHVLYERVARGRRARLHQLIGEHGERVYGARAGEIAAELAMHFDQGRDYRRAVRYLRQAAENDARRCAHREAVAYLRRALTMVERLPEAEATRLRLAVLEELGQSRHSTGDLEGAAEDFAALAALAREQGLVDVEVKALLSEAIAISWVAPERCRADFEQALALSPQLSNDLLRAHVRGFYGVWHSRFHGWRNEDVEASVAAIAAARQAGDRRLLSLHVSRHCYYQCLRSEYRAACRTAEEGAQLALEIGDAFDYLYSHYYHAMALLHLGEWEEMLKVLGEGMRMAEKNEHRFGATLFRLESAWLHVEALDFGRAREMCERALAEAQESGQLTNRLLGLVLLGIAHCGLGQYEQAFTCFSEITGWMDREPGSVQLLFQMPLRRGLSEHWLARGEFERARREAELLRELAAPSGERTYLALSYRILAEIAMAEQNWPRAEAELARALATLEATEAPLAEWRVCATAARLYQQQGRKPDADHYWTRSAASLNRLAGSLADATELRASLLNHPQVRAILSHAC